MSIIGLQRRYAELGRIRLGEKGPKGAPRRLDHFRLTSASESILEGAAKVYGGEVKPWTDAPSEGYFELRTETAALDVLVPPSLGDQGPYTQSYELWSGGGAQRRCDGVTELISGEGCKCDPDDRECEIVTRVSLILPNVPGLGVWRLDTGGYNAAVELPGTLDLLSMAAQGQRFIPAVLRLEQRTAKRPGPDGKPQTRRFSVPVLDVKGTTAELMSGPVPQITTGLVDTTPMAGLRLQQTTRTIDFGPEPEIPEAGSGVGNTESTEPAASAPSEAAGSPHPDAVSIPASGRGGDAEAFPASPAPISRMEFRRLVSGMKPGDVIAESQSLFPGTDPRALTDEQRGVLWAWLSQPNGLLDAAQQAFPDGVLVP